MGTNLYRFFLSIIFFLAVANLLMMNDIATVWSGAESYNLSRALSASEPLSFVQQVYVGVTTIAAQHPFWGRLVSAIVALFGGWGVYAIGQKILGRTVTVTTLLVAASTIGIVQLGKIATSDVWTATFHTLMVLTQIRYLKQPNVRWQTLHALFLTFATLSAPVATLLFTSFISLIWGSFHPQGRRSIQLYQWILLPVVLLVMRFVLDIPFATVDSYFVQRNVDVSVFAFYGLAVLGMLPWLGFAAAGIWQIIKRVRQREEFSIFMTTWLGAALLFKSWSILWLLSLLAAKQLEDYSIRNFPKINENIIKTLSILNLILAFCGAIYLMLNSFYLFEAAGFRSTMLTGAVYWMPLLFGVIGLYGKRQQLIRGGFASAGVLVTLVFWLQTYPLLQSQRNLPQRIVTALESSETEGRNRYILSPTINERHHLRYYLADRSLAFTVLSDAPLSQQYRDRGEAVFILDEIDYKKLAEQIGEELEGEAVKGWTERGGVTTYWILF